MAGAPGMDDMGGSGEREGVVRRLADAEVIRAVAVLVEQVAVVEPVSVRVGSVRGAEKVGSCNAETSGGGGGRPKGLRRPSVCKSWRGMCGGSIYAVWEQVVQSECVLVFVLLNFYILPQSLL